MSALCTGDAVSEHDVISKLLINYSTSARPVQHPSDITTVHFDVALAQIVQLDTKEQVLTTNLWIRQSWTDKFLTWKPEENGGITELHINSETIWRPDTVLYNRIHDEGWSATPDTNAIIQHTGDVFWPYPVTVRSPCLLDVSLFPYDVQRCPLEFGSWTYAENKLELVNVSSQGFTGEFILNGEWELLSFDADIHIHRNLSGGHFSTIEYTVEISRRALYYSYYVVGPSVLLGILALLGFCLSSGTGEKLAMSITTLLSLIVFFQLVIDKLPPTSINIPLIGKFFGGVIFLVTLSSVMTIFVLSLHFQGPKVKPVPQWLRSMFFMGPPKVLKVKVVRKDDESKAKGNMGTTSSNPDVQSISRSLARIEQCVSNFIEDYEKKSFTMGLRKEWEFLARQIDKCLLVIFLLAFVVMTISMLVSDLVNPNYKSTTGHDH
ncbi:neuronal acetylcholine receptor subunit alpha-10-like [Branchiostoma floridae x Branchiostoma japonicum]